MNAIYSISSALITMAPRPETGRPAIVELDALHASLTSTVGLPDIRLENCSRWPLKEQCGQRCLTELDVAPSQCLVSGVLMQHNLSDEIILSWSSTHRGSTALKEGQTTRLRRVLPDLSRVVRKISCKVALTVGVEAQSGWKPS